MSARSASLTLRAEEWNANSPAVAVQVAGTDVMECAYDAELEQGEEPFQRFSMSTSTRSNSPRACCAV